jgi:transposase
VASFSIHKVRDDLYISGVTSLGRVNNIPKNSQICLGKLLLTEQSFEYNDKFHPWIEQTNLSEANALDFFHRKGYNITKLVKKDNIDSAKDVYSVNDIISSDYIFIGANHLLNDICNKIGLTDIIKLSFPKIYYEILTLAKYQVVTQDPGLYCRFWVKNNIEHGEFINLSSQRISDLYHKITKTQINAFYNSWADFRQENEFLACDITSFSTYSNLNIEAAYGYNRDHDKLKQINLCMLFGETSGLPVFSSKYHGSLHDVKTFCTTIEMFNQLNSNVYKLVMDKGFFSRKNINYLLYNEHDIPFLISMPATNNIYKSLILDNLDIELNQDYQSSVIIGNDLLFYRTVPIQWDEKNNLIAHLFLNIKDKSDDACIKMYNFKEMYDLATQYPDKFMNDRSYLKYFTFRKSFKSNTGYKVTIKKTKSDEVSYKGWTILLSNHIKNSENAIKIYRNKNVVEESFNNLKNIIKSKKLRVHGTINIESKLFIDFISLILISYIHNHMEENGLYKKYTMLELLKEINLIKEIVIKGKRILFPITNEQSEILKIFNCPLPES